jgi:type VI protein secretion system component VasK
MRRHSFDPMSAVLGVIAVVAGLFVAVGEAVDLDVNWAWLITAAAILVGLAIIPWTWSAATRSDEQSASSADAADPTGGEH